MTTIKTMIEKERLKKHVAAVERAHAKFSASGSLRWLNCPGSIALSKDCPEQPESKYAKEGTKAHACLEFLLKNGANLKAALKIARKKYPLDMLEHCKDAAEAILDHFKGIEDATILCETRVDSSPFTCEGQFGTVDSAIVALFDRLIVIDFKYGAGHVVEPEGFDGRGHPQLVYYALALSHKYGHNFHDVELVVIQPRAYHASGETIRSHIMTIKELRKWEETFRIGVAIALGAEVEPDITPFLKHGEEWCRYCPAAFKCPEIKSKAMKRAQIVFDDNLGLESVPEPKLAETPDLAKMLDAADKLELWIKKVREHAFHVLSRGGKVDGYKLVQKKAMRKWVEGADKALLDHGFAFSEVYDSKPVSPAEFEKMLKSQKRSSTEIDSDERMMKDLTVKESSGLTLVNESDKRPAVRRLEEIFSDEVIDV